MLLVTSAGKTTDLECRNCMWQGYLNRKDEMDDTTICRRKSPIFINQNNWAIWPIVKNDDYCGDFQALSEDDYIVHPERELDIFSNDKHF